MDEKARQILNGGIKNIQNGEKSRENAFCLVH
jgi:hypothetical protein